LYLILNIALENIVFYNVYKFLKETSSYEGEIKMTIVAVILILVGFGTGLAIFMGLLPDSLKIISSQPIWIFWSVGIIGVILMVLNRRPHD